MVSLPLLFIADDDHKPKKKAAAAVAHTKQNVENISFLSRVHVECMPFSRMLFTHSMRLCVKTRKKNFAIFNIYL